MDDVKFARRRERVADYESATNVCAFFCTWPRLARFKVTFDHFSIHYTIKKMNKRAVAQQKNMQNNCVIKLKNDIEPIRRFQWSTRSRTRSNITNQ